MKHVSVLIYDEKTIKDTFDLSDVPRRAYWLGLAGVLPYLGTSVATIGVAQEMNVAHEQGMGYIFTAEQAEHLLHILEPLQVGYGAVVSTRPQTLKSARLTLEDYILPRRHPLGSRMGKLRR